MMKSAKVSSFIWCLAILCISCNSGFDSESNPVGPQSRFPFLYADSSNTIFMSWVEPTSVDNEFALLYSKLENGRWSNPEVIAQSNSWFVNWADYPSIIAKNERPVAVHWLQKIPGNTYSYNVNMKLNKDRGEWSDTIIPHADSTATEHGFVSMIPQSQNAVLAIWLDGRQTHNRADDEYFDLSKAMTLRSALIDSDGNISEKREIDSSVCDCCNTSLAATNDGAIAAYRNRTGEEIRDIYVSRFQNGEWTEPVAVHNDGWKIAACPVNGPEIAARDSTVAVAWYTGANDRQSVKVAFSSDMGSTFSEPITLKNEQAVGRVGIAIAENGQTYVSWIDREGGQTVIKVSTVSSDREITETRTVAPINESRSSGFPQMAATKDGLLFAWTDISEDGVVNTVNTATLPF